MCQELTERHCNTVQLYINTSQLQYTHSNVMKLLAFIKVSLIFFFYTEDINWQQEKLTSTMNKNILTFIYFFKHWIKKNSSIVTNRSNKYLLLLPWFLLQRDS